MSVHFIAGGNSNVISFDTPVRPSPPPPPKNEWTWGILGLSLVAVIGLGMIMSGVDDIKASLRTTNELLRDTQTTRTLIDTALQSADTVVVITQGMD
jgi:hypothetical protein